MGLVLLGPSGGRSGHDTCFLLIPQNDPAYYVNYRWAWYCSGLMVAGVAMILVAWLGKALKIYKL